MNLRISTSSSLRGSVTVPADKSISHRALLLGAIAAGVSHVRNWLPAADCQATLQAVRTLGIEVVETGPNAFEIRGQGLRGLRPLPKGESIDCQGSGTTMRLLAGILAGQDFSTVLDGHAGLRRRPMERIAAPLRMMGALVETTDGRPPMTIRGGNLQAIEYAMPVASAQVKSAVLLAGLYAEGETIVCQPGPARDHTERMLQSQGVTIDTQRDTIRLVTHPLSLMPLDVTVPADFSSAAFPLAAALTTPGSEVNLSQVNINPTRTGLLDVLLAMGADIQRHNEADVSGEPVADLLVRSSALHGGQVSGDTVVRMIDEFPVFAVVATQASGVTVVRDAQELRVKESDRIAAVIGELRKLGANVEEHPDGFTIEGPTQLKGTTVDSHGDHRLAMALVVAGMLAEGETTVTDTSVIGDSFPGFVSQMRQLGAAIE
jgi:3-phosphoshikimate 1-carboxyvinyltransferase